MGVPYDETGTDLGVPDDALAPGEDVPNRPSDGQVVVAIKALDGPIAQRQGQA